MRYLQSCPSVTVTRERLALALDAVGHPDADVRLRLVRTAEEAQELGFLGSPTVLVDGSFREDRCGCGLVVSTLPRRRCDVRIAKCRAVNGCLNGAASNGLGTQHDQIALPARPELAGSNSTDCRLHTDRHPVNYDGCGAKTSPQFGVVGNPLNLSATHCIERSPSTK